MSDIFGSSSDGFEVHRFLLAELRYSPTFLNPDSLYVQKHSAIGLTVRDSMTVKLFSEKRVGVAGGFGGFGRGKGWPDRRKQYISAGRVNVDGYCFLIHPYYNYCIEWAVA